MLFPHDQWLEFSMLSALEAHQCDHPAAHSWNRGQAGREPGQGAGSAPAQQHSPFLLQLPSSPHRAWLSCQQDMQGTDLGGVVVWGLFSVGRMNSSICVQFQCVYTGVY